MQAGTDDQSLDLIIGRKRPARGIPGEQASPTRVQAMPCGWLIGLALLIEDDGIKLSLGGPAGDGLGNMKARMKDMGGEFAQRGGRDRGTVTKLTLPWEPS